MTWTAIAFTNKEKKPVHFHFNGPHSAAKSFDQACAENDDLFIVCVVPGSHPVLFSYEYLHIGHAFELIHAPFTRTLSNDE